MKSLLLICVIVFSSSAFARQYIQCSSMDMSTTDVMVVNLQTVNGGTLFISSGMQNPEDERTLVKIALQKTEAGNHYYETQNGMVTIPSEVIGKSSDFFVLHLRFNYYAGDYSCFARIYND